MEATSHMWAYLNADELKVSEIYSQFISCTGYAESHNRRIWLGAPELDRTGRGPFHHLRKVFRTVLI